MTLSILLQAASQPAQQGSGWMSFLPIILIVVVFYFFLIRPQQQRQKAIEKQRAALKKGDKIVTSGGIHGTLDEVNDTYYLVEVANGVKIRVDKASVFALGGDVPTR